MRNRTPSRKQRFAAAVSLRGMTQADWAKQHDVTAGHLSVVLNGKRESAALLRAIDEFIADVLGESAAMAA